MIKLINGRGQLGSALNDIIEKEKIQISPDVFIYHTWNIDDKSEQTQRNCYEEFKNFVDKNLDSKIIFTSTYSQKENYYNYYKQISEAYLLSNHKKGYVLRIPTLIGKGICEKFRNNEVNAFGNMELLSVESAARSLIDFLLSDRILRNYGVEGVKVPASFVKRIILFGKEGK